MTNTRFSTADYAVFGVVLVVSSSIGIAFAFLGRKKQTTSEFLFGGRSMHALPVSMSVLATFVSAITLLGVPSEVYQFGIQYWMICLSYLLVMPATAHIYTPVFYKLRVNSIYEYLEKRYNRFVRTMVFVVSVIHELIYVAFVIYAPSLVLSQVTGVHKWICVSIIGVVCTFYTSIGGYKAVIWTDVFQVSVIFISLLAIACKGIIDAGGINTVWERAQLGQRTLLFDFDFDPTKRHTFWTLSIGGFVTWLNVYATKASLVQRSLSISTLKGAQFAIWLNIPGNILNVTLCCLVGLVVYAHYYNCDPLRTHRVENPNQVFPLLVTDSLTVFTGFPGLFVAAIFSATFSTLSSVLNTMATVTLEDIVKVFVAPDISEARATTVAKWLGVVYGVVAVCGVAIADQMGGTVLEAALAFSGSFGGPIFGLFTLSMLFPWPNALGATLGFLAGQIVSQWICLGAVLNRYPHPKAPTSVEGCSDTLFNTTITSTNATFISSHYPYEGLSIYRMSYLWYSAVGCIVTIVIGLFLSVLTGGSQKKMDPRVFCSFTYKIWPETSFNLKEEDVEKETLPVNNDIKNSEKDVIKEKIEIKSLPNGEGRYIYKGGVL